MRIFEIFTVLVSLILLHNSQGNNISQGSSLRRVARGLLSRTGLCPNPKVNNRIRDNRLNFYGRSYTLPPDPEDGKFQNECQESECQYDAHCNGNEKCCTNVCGATICTEAVRDPHPCSMFSCPNDKICKLQRVRCIFPDCPDLYAVPRPICVPAKLVPYIAPLAPPSKPMTPGAFPPPGIARKRSKLPGTLGQGGHRLTDQVYIYPHKPFFRRLESETKKSTIPRRAAAAKPQGVYMYPERPFYGREEVGSKKTQVLAPPNTLPVRRNQVPHNSLPFRRNQVPHNTLPLRKNLAPHNTFPLRRNQVAHNTLPLGRHVQVSADATKSFTKWVHDQHLRSQIAQRTFAGEHTQHVYVSPERPIPKRSTISLPKPIQVAEGVYLFPDRPYFRLQG